MFYFLRVTGLFFVTAVAEIIGGAIGLAGMVIMTLQPRAAS